MGKFTEISALGLRNSRAAPVEPVSVTYGQMVDGVNHFYADYRNRLIPLGFAFGYVEREIEGNPAPQAELEAMRRKSASPETERQLQRKLFCR
jgi:hypothetical protein